MALLKGNLLSGLVIGVAAYALMPALSRAARPTAKALIKAGLQAYERGRETFAELGETTGDMVAEARSELAHDAPPETAPEEPIQAEQVH